MKGSVKVRNLEVKPGMYLRDKEFHGNTGVSYLSLWFWKEIKEKVGQVVNAEMKYDKKHWYRLVLTTTEDVTVILSGCSAGYRGEGCRATAQVLKDAGFNPKRVEEVVFSDERFTLRRRAK